MYQKKNVKVKKKCVCVCVLMLEINGLVKVRILAVEASENSSETMYQPDLYFDFQS